MNNKPLVSVIIPTRNSARTIEACLKSIKKQTYKNIELIVVDNNSTDDTKKIAKKYTSLVFNKGPERAFQLNFGVTKANGKYIYYTGSDIDRDNVLIEEAVNKMEKEDCDAIYLNVLTKLKTNSIWEKVRALERQVYFKEKGVSAARIYKKDMFVRLGGLDETFSGVSDDLEFQYRIDLAGYKTGFINATEYTIGDYSSYSIIVTRALYYGWFLSGYMKKHPSKTKQQYKPVRDEFIKKRKLLTKDKLLFLFFVIYKITQYGFGGLGVFLCRVTNKNKKLEKFLYNLNYTKK